jgi:hypothetical protein
MAGILGYEREALRPGIDKAFIVPGLEELGPADRRKLAEADGKCWFCGTKGCDMCGGRKFTIMPETGFERNAVATGKRSGQGVSRLADKRLKNEGYIGMKPMSAAMFSSPFHQSHQQFGFEQSCNQPKAPYDYGQGGLSVPSFNSFHNTDGETAIALQSNIDPALLTWPSTQFPQSSPYQGSGQSGGVNDPQEQVVQEEHKQVFAQISKQNLSAVSMISFQFAGIASRYV